MLAKTPIGNRFYNWVNAQAPERRYAWHDNCNCACGRFLIEEMGMEREDVQRAQRHNSFPMMTEHKVDLDAVEVWRLFNGVAYIAYGGGSEGERIWTFGALAQRLRETRPECVS